MQKSALFLVAAVLCVVAVQEAFGGGGKGKGGMGGMMKEMMKKCGDEEINVEEAMKGKDECIKELKDQKKGGGDEERKRRSPDGDGEGGGCKKGKGRRGGMGKFMCAGVCMWKKQGVLDADGKWNEAGAKEQIDKVYPEKHRAGALDKWKACAASSSDKFSMDNNCAGYKDFKSCLFKAHMDECGIKFGGFGGKGKGKGKNKEADDDDEE